MSKILFLPISKRASFIKRCRDHCAAVAGGGGGSPAGSACDGSPPPLTAPLHLLLLECSPPTAVIPSNVQQSIPPVTAPLYLRKLPFNCDHFPPPVSNPLHQHPLRLTGDCPPPDLTAPLHLLLPASNHCNTPQRPTVHSTCDRAPLPVTAPLQM